MSEIKILVYLMGCILIASGGILMISVFNAVRWKWRKIKQKL